MERRARNRVTAAVSKGNTCKEIGIDGHGVGIFTSDHYATCLQGTDGKESAASNATATVKLF